MAKKLIYKERFERLVTKAEKGDHKSRKLLLNMSLAGNITSHYGPHLVTHLRQVARDYTEWLDDGHEATEDEVDQDGYQYLMTELRHQAEVWNNSDTDQSVESTRRANSIEELWSRLECLVKFLEEHPHPDKNIKHELEIANKTLERNADLSGVGDENS